MNLLKPVNLSGWCLLALTLLFSPVRAADLDTQFAQPPASARPWVYWFWNNGNVTKAGITADLEAMQRAGIGGVIIMDVVERFAPPAGTADFMNAEWQELFRFAVSEAHRLGLKINMTNGPGWCGSSGPWITPELSMQRLVSTNCVATGPGHYSSVLPVPDIDSKRWKDSFDSSVNYPDYYSDIAVLAFPENSNGVAGAETVTNLTDRLDREGKLDWEVPAGRWIIERIGHTTTGSSTRPPVKGGNGLECDKLSREAMDVHFSNMMGKLIQQSGRMAGATLSATHIDSWEVGSQNWTPRFREEFQKRRGYDPVPYLPDVSEAKIPGTAVRCSIGDEAIASRFRWDFQQTLSELLAENYVGRLAELAHRHGMHLTIEGYNLPFGDEAIYTERADEPMSEFWATGGNENEAKGRQMASVAHVMGEKVVGAEAFTSGDNEQWKFHPATVKALGDYEFSQGINRFVIHRYAHQPYLDRFPGATMGPWGLHYERTQTWWEMSGAWHQYLARCQFLLRQGLFVADLCYLRPQLADQTYFTATPAVPAGYKYDECSASALMARMHVKGGRLVLPDGMSYRLLVLPVEQRRMSPALVEKIKALVKAGATVYGPPPTGAPGLSDYPRCDERVVRLAAEVWGNCDGKAVTEHAFGKGKVIWGQPLERVLDRLNTPVDFSSSVKLNWLHRQVGKQQFYFVANDRSVAVDVECRFREQGLRPELWDPQTGKISPLVLYWETNGMISLPLRLEASGAAFVVFRSPSRGHDAVVDFRWNGRPVLEAAKMPVLEIQSASYGVAGDASRRRDVASKVRMLANAGEYSFPVGRLAEGDDPAYGVVKTLDLSYTTDGKPHQVHAQDPEIVNLFPLCGAPAPTAELRGGKTMKIEARSPGRYEVRTSLGKMRQVEIKTVPPPLQITGAWSVQFPPRWGAPEQITLERLCSLSESTNAGVKYFSGTATYRKSFDWAPSVEPGEQRPEAWLDLGEVQVMARVQLNGQDLGVLWKAPFQVNVTGALKIGRNELLIQMANLWPNRMIGDAALPAAQRFTWSSYEPFKPDSPLPSSGLLGPVVVRTSVTVPLPPER